MWHTDRVMARSSKVDKVDDKTYGGYWAFFGRFVEPADNMVS